MDNKAQESMPIQLLLGVTILTFVITIGFYSYRQACATQYDHRVRAGLDRLRSEIEFVYRGGVGTTSPKITLDTTVPPGCDIGFESVRLLDGPKDQCEANIGKEDCVMIVAVTVDEHGNRHVSSRSYVDVPGGTDGVTIDMEGFGQQDCHDYSYGEIFEDDDAEPGEDYCGWGTGKFTLQVIRKSEDTILIEQL